MIVQEFYMDDYKILTLIHENMDGGIKNRHLNDSIFIGKHIVSFKEYYQSDFKLDEIDYDMVIDGFLECKNEKNPYNDYATFYKELVSFQENAIFEDSSPIVPLDEYGKLLEFIKGYSNYNFTRYSFGNILFFSPIKIKTINFYSDNLPYFKIVGTDVKGIAIVKFKVNDIILESKIVENLQSGQKICCKCDWNNYEIEVYYDDEIIYKNHSKLYRNINMSLNNAYGNRRLLLNKGKSSVAVVPQNTENFYIGERNQLDIISEFLTDEHNFISSFINNDKDKCLFLIKKERDGAFKFFMDLTKKPGTFWIFDPYFFSQKFNPINEIIDFLMIIINQEYEKNIVFSKYADGSFEKFIDNLSDSQLNYFKKNQFSNINFIESKENFHDRFIFYVSNDKIKGYQIGTSINSLGKNYSNIVKLDDFCCHYIFKILMEDIVSEKIFNICD